MGLDVTAHGLPWGAKEAYQTTPWALSGLAKQYVSRVCISLNILELPVGGAHLTITSSILSVMQPIFFYSDVRNSDDIT